MLAAAHRTAIVTCLAVLVVVASWAAAPQTRVPSNAPPPAGASVTFVVSGKVVGGSGQHPIFVGLWDAHSFLHTPIQQVRIEPGAAPVFHFNVPAGRWALSAFEDKNNNGVLDMGLFGPKEPSGFWRAFHAWRPPRFSDVASQITRDVADADIRLK